MKKPTRLLSLSLFVLAWSPQPPIHAADVEYKAELFKSTRLLYADTFDGPLNRAFWEVRQNTTWAIKDGVLTGRPSSSEFQEKKKASADPSHAGLKPVIWLKQVRRISFARCACATARRPTRGGFRSSISVTTLTRLSSTRGRRPSRSRRTSRR